MNDAASLSCTTALDRFAEFLDGELGDEDSRGVERHLGGCGRCVDLVRDLAGIHRDLLVRGAREEMAAQDPIPAVLARVRWSVAASRRPRRITPESPAAAPALIGLAAAFAAGLLLAMLGIPRNPALPPTPRQEAPAVVELPAPEAPTLPPAPNVEKHPAPETPRTILRHDDPAPVPEELPPRRPKPEVPAPPSPAPSRESAVAFARVEQTGRPLTVGETLVADARTVVAYPDGTRLFVSPDTALTFEGRGKTISVARGEVFADVTPQPRDEPMTFLTPLAEVRVLGTWLSVAQRAESTVVSVEKGRVQATRKADRWSLSLREGQYAAVEAGRLPQARPLPPNLVADPGFEADGKGWEGVFNRALGRNFGGISVSSDVAHSGGRALQMITQPTPGYDREVYQDFPVTPGDALEASGWLRTSGVGGKGVSLSLLWLSGTGSPGGDPAPTLRAKGLVLREDVAGTRSGTGEWTRLATRAVAPPQAKQVRVLLYADVDPDGPATAWFDDLILRRFQKGK